MIHNVLNAHQKFSPAAQLQITIFCVITAQESNLPRTSVTMASPIGVLCVTEGNGEGEEL